MARKILATLSSSKTVSLPSGTGYTPQSLAFVTCERRYVICSGGSGNRIVRASSKGYTKLNSVIHTGHANGGCYCNKDGRVYTSTYSGSATKRIAVWEDWKYVKGIDIPTYCTGIAYDRNTENFYVSAGDHVYVYSYNELNKKSGKKKYGTVTMKHGVVGFWQDCGGYGGVILRCTSRQNTTSTSYIDCYRAADGKYLGSLRTTGEIESVAVDSELHFHVIYAQNRRIVKTKQTFKSVGLGGNAIGYSGTGTQVVKKQVPQGNKIVAQARKYKGEGYSRFCKWAGINADWCAIFVRFVFNKCGLSNLISNKNYVPVDFSKDILAKGGKVIWSKDGRIGKTGGSKKNALPGDLAFYSGHINIVCRGSKDGVSVLTIGGNQRGGGHWSNNKVTEYSRSDMIWIIRPAYKDNAINGLKVTGDTYLSEEEEVGMGTLEVHPEQLYSSANYMYIKEQEEQESAAETSTKQAIQGMLESAASFRSVPRDTSSNIGIITGGVSSSAKNPVTKVDGEAHGPSLSTALFPVEAPFAEITIGGETFGAGYKDDAPNYIESLSVRRTNASMAEYTINLSHQVSPGRNPNYIDELLSANGYEKIGIRFGDAMSEVDIVDNNAILSNVNTTFDFQSCNIKYSVSAISSNFLSSTNKRNFPAITDKGSNIARGLLKSAQSSLAEIYPKMLDNNYVMKNNLIPNTDTVISMKAMENVNDITYLKEVVSSMQSLANPNSMFYLELREEDFKIHEISSDGYSSSASLYEVDINYPDDAQVFSFSDSTDFAWSLAYEYNGKISNYTYSVSDEGKRISIPGTSNNMFNDQGALNISENWWKQVTEFPTTATLTCRGLLSPLLLMTYIKVNSYYYGSKRLTSGVYIVTGQEDIISGGGFRTNLSLTKVSGPDQHLTVDARVKT